jgi:23S rRNA pseudouridine2605 synthase
VEIPHNPAPGSHAPGPPAPPRRAFPGARLRFTYDGGVKSGWDKLDQADLQNPARGVRLQRHLAELGVGARRACERLIEEGRVEINGRVVTKLPIFVDPGHDHISVDGRPLQKTDKIRRLYVMLNKPERTLTVSADEPGADRRTVLDLVQHPGAKRLYPVGRLEYDATGLVLLTNDGALANRLSHPKYGISKVYHALVKGNVPDDALAELEQEIFLTERKAARTQTRMRAAGVKFKGDVPKQLRTSKPIKGIYRAAHVRLRAIKRAEGKTTVEITLTEGRNRHVEGIFAARGFSIRKLTQVSLGPLTLTGLALGAWRELERDEITALLRAVKDRSAGKPGQTPKPAPVKTGDPEIRERWNAGKPDTGPRGPAPEPRAKPPVPIADTPETYQDRGPVAPSKRRPRVIGGKR